MTPKDAQSLLRRYLAGECTPAEKELVESWFIDMGEEYPGEVTLKEPGLVHDRMLERIRAELQIDREKADHARTDHARTDVARTYGETADGERSDGVRELQSDTFERRPVKRMVWFAGIAAAVLFLAIGIWFLVSRPKEGPANVTAKIDIEANPGGDKAILTLGNGQHMVLDSAGNGMLVTEGASRVTKENGQLDYQTEAGKAKNEIAYNTLTTQRGGQYKLVLSDGTKIWLDALSSITYPTAFTGDKRRVSIVGQAYFEVAHDVNHPFEVEVRGQVVRDIGTSFNINAYTDEPAMKVTLSTGAAAVGVPGHEIVLKRAGQQAEWKDGQLQKAPDADLESVLAWKNGLFYLTSADIGTVMRQISRWYDVEVAFENGVPDGHISGVVPRNTMLSTVLQVLRTSGVHFTVEGRKIYVTP